MNESEQKQIFDVNLDGVDLDAINNLVNKHKANATLTQQLALDAAKLVTTSQERLAKQTEAGFFKRLTNTISGKTSENQLLNQKDILQMQKFAWHYLQQLQQQNLINAQSIAVIRNNLGTMNEYIIETRDFLEIAIDKIDNRLRHVENHTSFNNWSLNIDANKRRFKSFPKTLLILRLTYDFMRSHQDIVLTERDISNYLVTTLEKLDVNCDENVKFLDLISDLIDQIEIAGIDQYRATIDLSFDGHTIDSDYIQKNISGIGFNALYFLSDYYEKIIDLIGDDELCNTDEAREKIIAKFFGNEFSGLSSIYSIRNLICEMIGGSQLTIDIYKEEHGLNVILDEGYEESQPELVKLVSSLPEIHSHTFLDSHESNESKHDYLLLLALGIENSASLNNYAHEFITLLVEKYEFPELLKEILELADNSRKYNDYQQVIQTLLDDEDKKCTWLLDIFFLLKINNKEIENSQTRTLLGILKPAQIKECFPNMMVILNEDDSSLVLNAAENLAPHTQGWKNIIRYREMKFNQCFDETMKQLNSISFGITRMGFETMDLYRKGIEHSYFCDFSDGNFLSNLSNKAGVTFCEQGRKSALSELNEFRKKAENYITDNCSALYQANRMISRWNFPPFELKNKIPYSDFELDNSVSNEDWGNQFEYYYRQTEKGLEAFSEACDDANGQLGFFVKGNFDQSVLKLREQKREEYLRQQELEKLAKQSVTIIKDGSEHLLTIKWQKVENFPCNPDEIEYIKTDGKIWLINARVDYNDVFYRSEDGVHWQKIQLDTEKRDIRVDEITVINGTWIVKFGSNDGYYYSDDALTWQHGSMPKLSGDYWLRFKNIIHFDGIWLWQATQREEYSYTEKGLIFDSKETSSYDKSILFCTENLKGPWKRWENEPRFSEGVEIEAICSIPGKNALLAFCKDDWFYVQKKKKPERPPFVMYYGATKSWQNCGWNGDSSIYRSPIFVDTNDGLVCFSSGEILTSEKGYEWNKQKEGLYVDDYFPLKNLSIFVKDKNIYISQDTKIFKELMLEDGTWNYLSANDKGILGLYRENKHEETALRIGHYVCKAKNL